MQHPSYDIAVKVLERLQVGSIKDVFDYGLHEYLEGFIDDNSRFSQAVADNYRFT